MDNNDLLSQFSARPQAQSTETVPLRVLGYVLPPQGQPETPQNARVLAQRWDTGEKVELALRDAGADRPGISNFQADRGANPVTTEVGGTIVADRVYTDAALTPLSGRPVKVLNSRWLNRVAQTKNDGWALSTLARVDEPRTNPNNPSKPYQTVTLMQADRTLSVNSIEELDQSVLDLLDTEARDADPRWHERPGNVMAFVRLSTADGSRSDMMELRGGFYQPGDSRYKLPKTREQMAEDLAAFGTWQTKRAQLSRAFNSPDWRVDVIPGSRVFVGSRTLQKSQQTGGRIKGLEFSDGTPLFSKMVIGLRKYPDVPNPAVVLAGPATMAQVASRTGIPNAEERAVAQQYETRAAARDAQPQAPTREQPQQQAAPRQQAQQQAQAQPQPQPQPQQQTQPQGTVAPVRIERNPQGGLTLNAADSSQRQRMEQVASELAPQGARFNATNGSVSIPDSLAPAALKQLGNAKLPYEVVAEQAQQPQQQAAPQQPAPQQTAPTPEQAPPANTNFDLSSLDLSDLDLDDTLNQAYNQYQNHTPER